jgi:hypothetical protein
MKRLYVRFVPTQSFHFSWNRKTGNIIGTQVEIHRLIVSLESDWKCDYSDTRIFGGVQPGNSESDSETAHENLMNNWQ